MFKSNGKTPPPIQRFFQHGMVASGESKETGNFGGVNTLVLSKVADRANTWITAEQDKTREAKTS